MRKLVVMSKEDALLICKGLSLLSRNVSQQLNQHHIKLSTESENEVLSNLDSIDRMKKNLQKIFDF